MFDIAICDDSELDRSLLIEDVRKCEKYRETVRFHQYSSGKELLAAMELTRFSLIFLDIQMQGMDGERTAEEIRKMEPDVIVVVAFGQIIPKEILDMPKYGCINVHASLLPAYRGAAPIQWAVMNGDEVSGVTIMKMDEGLDTGDMLTKVEVPLAADETGGSLFDKLAAAGAKLLVETLPKLEKGEVTPEKQPEISTTEYARMIKKEDGKIDWTKSAVEIERQIRAMSPWPSAFTKVNGKNLKIWDAKVIAMFGGDLFSKIPGQNPTKSAGKVWVADETGLHVKTGDGILVIEELQLEGKKRMKTADFLRGYAIEPGTRLGE